MNAEQNYFRVENLHAQLVLALFSVLALSGGLIWWMPGLSTSMQWTVLLHTLLGMVVIPIAIVHVVIHVPRTLGIRRLWVQLSGMAAMSIFVALAATGLRLVFQGQSEAVSWLPGTHVLLATAFCLAIVVHGMTHAFTTTRRRDQDLARWPSLAGNAGRIFRTVALSSALLLVLAEGAYRLRGEVYDDTAAIQPYRLNYGKHPFRPSQTETSSGGFLDARRQGESARCASCHAEISRQWQASMHARAASDQAYQANVKLLAEKRGIEATRYCEGCHAPVALLSGQLSQGGRLDTQGHAEGISCMSCHAIERIEHLQGVASFRIQPPAPYLFEGSQHPVASWLHDLVLRLKPERHKADLARPVLSSPELCATCHAQFMDKDFNGWGWVKMQDDYQAWLKSPYSGQSKQTFAHAVSRRCQDCHFSMQTGIDPSANRNGLIKTHFALGANTAIPWLKQDHGQLQRTIDFLQADQMRVTLDKPNREDAIQSSRSLGPSPINDIETPAYAYLGESVSIDVAVSNTQIGHAFPGGTTDINEAWLHFRVSDAYGDTVYESGAVDSRGDVDGSAYFYRSIAIDRFGNEVWRHDLFNMIGDRFKRVIAPGETDVTSYRFKVADATKGPLSISVRLRYRKFNNRYAHWALDDESLSLPIVDVAVASLILPLKSRPEILATQP